MTTASKASQKEDLPVLGIWLFWTVFGAIVATILYDGMGSLPELLPEILAFCFGGVYVWAALTIPIFRIVGRSGAPRLTVANTVGPIVACTVLAVLVSVGFSGLIVWADWQMGSVGFKAAFHFRFPMDLLASLLLFTAGTARRYLDDLRVRQQEADRLRAQLAEARLAGLRAQLHPHFLFNTLNAVSGLAKVDPARVPGALAALGDLLRHFLESSGREEARLSDELQLLRRYLALLELRYGDWLQTRIDVASDVGDPLVPHLILQPLVENALKHGIARAGEGSILVGVHREDDALVLSITDSGPGEGVVSGEPSQTTRREGFGLRHVKERLTQVYGGEASFALDATHEGGMRAWIRLPYRTESALSDSAESSTGVLELETLS
jgi:sensor histidine kinase YesM